MIESTQNIPELQVFFKDNNFPAVTRDQLIFYFRTLQSSKRKYALKVLNYLISITNRSEYNFCEASQVRIAKDIGCTERTVRRWIKRLKLMGILTTIRRRYRIPKDKRRLGCAHKGWASMTNITIVNYLLTKVKDLTFFMALYLPALFSYEGLRPVISPSVLSYKEKRYLYNNYYINGIKRPARRTSWLNGGGVVLNKNSLKQEKSINPWASPLDKRRGEGMKELGHHMKGLFGSIVPTKPLKKEVNEERLVEYICYEPSCIKRFTGPIRTLRCWYCASTSIRQQHSR